LQAILATIAVILGVSKGADDWWWINHLVGLL